MLAPRPLGVSPGGGDLRGMHPSKTLGGSVGLDHHPLGEASTTCEWFYWWLHPTCSRYGMLNLDNRQALIKTEFKNREIVR